MACSIKINLLQNIVFNTQKLYKLFTKGRNKKILIKVMKNAMLCWPGLSRIVYETWAKLNNIA
jgi:hypothetical protein